jgi:hypothetical protein
MMNGRTIIPPAFNETTNPTLISFFVANHFPKLRSNLENQLKISLLHKKDNGEQSLTER